MPSEITRNQARRLKIIATCALVIAVADPVTTAAQASARVDTTRYTVLMAGRTAGFQKTWRDADGIWRVHFEYNDRGRGPLYKSEFTLGPRGGATRVHTTGVDYFKSPVDETFTLRGRTATWKNSAEGGGANTPGAFYLSLDGAPEELGFLARALLAEPNQRIALLPAGEARIARVGTLAVTAKGAARTVTHYAITGLGLAPVDVWLDANRRLFAVGGSWQMTIREGYEESAKAIVDAQNVANAARAGRLARTLARRPSRPVVFRNGNLFDADSAVMRPGMSVVVQGNRITAVGAAADVPIPEGAEVIDASGKTIMPGMWDMHTHIQDDDGILSLAAGITTVRDLANDTDELLARRAAFDAGSKIGPRIVMAGFMDGPGPYAGPTKVLVSTPEEGRAAVNRYADLGYVQIKLYSSIKTELVPVIIAAAHARGLRVSGHVPAFMSAEQMVQAGADELQHVNFILLNFWADSVQDTRTPLRFTAVAERAADLDLSSARVQDFIRLLKERGTVVDPTINIFENMFTARKGTLDPGYAMIAPRLPATVRRNLLTGGLPVPEGKDARYRESFAVALRMVGELHRGGVTLVAGTDAFTGFAYHRELELYQAAGIPTLDVLRIATLGAARVAKRDRELGSIAQGKLADIILIDGNPADRMSDVRRVSRVMKDGVLYDPAALYRSAGVQPAIGQ